LLASPVIQEIKTLLRMSRHPAVKPAVGTFVAR
jgi:hypothetical protein